MLPLALCSVWSRQLEAVLIDGQLLPGPVLEQQAHGQGGGVCCACSAQSCFFRASPAVAGASQGAVLQACMPLCPMGARQMSLPSYKLQDAASGTLACSSNQRGCQLLTSHVGICWPAFAGP